MGLLKVGSMRFGLYALGSCTRNGPTMAITMRTTIVMPPAIATLSRRSRRQAIWPRDRPAITGAPGAVAVASGSIRPGEGSTVTATVTYQSALQGGHSRGLR